MKKSKTKDMLTEATENALLAVEIYNKPLAKSRVKTYVVLMIIAYTSLFHAFFHQNIGDKYFYKVKKSNRYIRLKNREKKAWELTKCIKEYKKYKSLSPSIEANNSFFIELALFKKSTDSNCKIIFDLIQ